VGDVQAAADLLGPRHRIDHRRRAALQDLAERAALDLLHHQVDGPAPVHRRLADVADGHHVRIVQGGCGQRLAVKSQHQVLVPGAGQHLHRDLATEPLVDRPPDLAHSAGAQEAGLPVAAREGDAVNDASFRPAPQRGP
jgi:hypothetical protein